MEFWYKKCKERYDSLQDWATEENLKGIKVKDRHRKTEWKQFHKDTFHINPFREKVGNSKEVEIWDVSKLSTSTCSCSTKTDCLMMQDMVKIVQLVYKKLMPTDSSPSELLQALRPTETGKRKVSKVAGQTLDCYCVCCELLSASIADVL